MEIGRMGTIVHDMLVKIRVAYTSQDRHAFDEVEKMDDQIDLLREYIIHYLVRSVSSIYQQSRNMNLFPS